MIDESLSIWWASFKVNSGSLSTRCWLSSLSLFLSLSLSLAVSMVYHFPPPPVCFSSSLPTPTATYLPHLSLPPLSPASITLPRLALLHLPLPPLSLSLLSLAPSSHLSCLFYSASLRVITQIALSALWWETLLVSLSLSFFSFSLCPISYCLTLSWCFSSRQLMENKISTIERGAFQDLKELERLWVTFCNRGGRHFMP